MSEIGSDEPEASGIETKIVVVDGADGLTPEMLRSRDRTVDVPDRPNPAPFWYQQDRMHD